MWSKGKFLYVPSQSPHPKDGRGRGDVAPHILYLAMDGGEWSISLPGYLIT